VECAECRNKLKLTKQDLGPVKLGPAVVGSGEAHPQYIITIIL